MLRLNHFAVVFLIIAFQSIHGHSQAKRYVVCDGNRTWVVSDRVAIPVSDCHSRPYAYAFVISDDGSLNEHRRTPNSQAILSALNAIGRSGTTLYRMEQTDLDLIIERTGGARPVMISRRFLSKAAQGALISDQSAAKEMSFIITIGYADPKGYHESSRHSIKVNSSNPQIAEILEEAKRIPLPWGMSDHKDYLFLERAKDNEELDPSKTARDYNLESGEVLRLFSSLR